MRLLHLTFILCLPFLVRAGCGCEQVEKELERERTADAAHHSCRTCKPLAPSMDACPEVGYECDEDWPFTSNVLTATDDCACSELRCAGEAKLFVDKFPLNRLRCNNSQWMVRGAPPTDGAVCANSCNKGVCPASAPKHSADFVPLNVQAATAESKCATGTCEPSNGMASINADGSVREALTGVDSVKCSGSGAWTYGEGGKSQFVMCNASPCGPSRCPTYVNGTETELGNVIPLTVVSNGKECATAKCSGHEEQEFQVLNADGTFHSDLTVPSITCRSDGMWEAPSMAPPNTNQFIMCRSTLPCSFRCDQSPFTPSTLNQQLKSMIRRDCIYSCPAGQTLFREHPYDGAVSTESATCAAQGAFSVDSSEETVERIGCWTCDVPDGPIESTSEVKPEVNKCVMTCKSGYKLQYGLEDTDLATSDRPIYRTIKGDTRSALWYTAEKGHAFNEDVKYVCTPEE